MSPLAVTGVGMLTPGARTPTEPDPHDPWPLPPGPAHRVELDAVAVLGRRTARFNHRSTLLAMVACDEALRDAGLDGPDVDRDRIGITVGTTAGSITGTVQFGMDTFAQARPYLVDASAFPNAVINRTAGALAIRAGLRGANTTVAAGPLAGIAALRHAQVALGCGHVDGVVTGAAEEVSGPTAWWAAASPSPPVAGEGAAMVVLEPLDVAAARGRRAVAHLLATGVRRVDTNDPGQVAAAVRSVLRSAGVTGDDVGRVAVRRTGSAEVDQAQSQAVATVTRAVPEHLEDRYGDCKSAHAALQVAQVVQDWRVGASTVDVALVLGADPAGALAVAVLGRPEREAA